MTEPKRTVFRTPRVPRRQFLAMSGMGIAGVALLAACGEDDDPPPAAAPAATPAATPETAATPAAATPAAEDEPEAGQVLVGDVLDHRLRSDDWPGEYGWVRFQLHHGFVEGDDAYFIRTDASDQQFANDESLLFVPIMAQAIAAGGVGLSAIYLFEAGADGQAPVLSSAPHMDDFSPAYRVYRVTANAEAGVLRSVSDVQGAASNGLADIEETDIVVNYPVVKWPGGELPHDPAREVYLGDGQLIDPVDTNEMTVTFKLHKCYPNSRYIVTDATMMADMMNIAPAPGAAPLTDAGATAEILVFGNGIEGSGPMGFQTSVTDTLAGEMDWSPFWDHYTFVWEDNAEPEVLRSNAEVVAAEESGDLQRYNGMPDMHPTLFMVNCPVPVIAPVA
jgi:hypothetical protein